MELNKKIIILIVSILFSAITFNAQTFPKFWIKLKDKTGTPYSVSTPSAFVTSKCILRRTTYSVPFDQTDLPVTPAYITQIEATPNVTVLYASKWMNAIAIKVTSTVALTISTATNAINSYSFVLGSNPTNKFKIVLEKPIEADANTFMNRSESGPVSYMGAAYWQAHQLNVDCMHGYCYRGQGMTIAILDAGFNNANNHHAFDSLFARGGVLGTQDFVSGGPMVYDDDPHGCSVLSCIAACVPSVMVGTAPRANFWLLRTEDAATETPSEEYNWIRGAEFADSVGADILTTSLGYTTFDNAAYNQTYAGLNGKTYPMSIAATMASRKGMFVLNAAGNEGQSAWQFIGVPADADSICTVGAIDSLNMITGFSSKGPTSDGRIKPDLVARGGNAYVATSGGGYSPGNGTSFATPIMAGAVACFWQRFNTFNNMKVLDTLKHTASYKLNPNNSYGWGIPDICALPVGLKDYYLQQTVFSVYPNPFSNKVKVKMVSVTNESYTIEVLNIIGTSIKTIKSTEQELTLDLNSYASGVYFIKVNTGSGSAMQKVVKE